MLPCPEGIVPREPPLPSSRFKLGNRFGGAQDGAVHGIERPQLARERGRVEKGLQPPGRAVPQYLPLCTVERFHEIRTPGFDCRRVGCGAS